MVLPGMAGQLRRLALFRALAYYQENHRYHYEEAGHWVEGLAHSLVYPGVDSPDSDAIFERSPLAAAGLAPAAQRAGDDDGAEVPAQPPP